MPLCSMEIQQSQAHNFLIHHSNQFARINCINGHRHIIPIHTWPRPSFQSMPTPTPAYCQWHWRKEASLTYACLLCYYISHRNIASSRNGYTLTSTNHIQDPDSVFPRKGPSKQHAFLHRWVHTFRSAPSHESNIVTLRSCTTISSVDSRMHFITIYRLAHKSLPIRNCPAFFENRINEICLWYVERDRVSWFLLKII